MVRVVSVNKCDVKSKIDLWRLCLSAGEVYADELLLQGRTNTNQQQHSEGDALVEVPLLHGDGDQQAADEEHVGVFQVFNADLKHEQNNQ